MMMDLEQGMYDDEPQADEPCPVAVGDEIEVHGKLTLINDVGGTSDLPLPGARVRVASVRWDYETGWRFTGQLLDDEAIAAARLAGITGYDAEHYRRTFPDQPHLAESTERAAAAFDPSKVFFSEFDIAPRSAPTM